MGTDRSDSNETVSEKTGPDEHGGKGFLPLRIWPAVLLIVVMFALRYGLNLIPDPPVGVMMTQALGPLVCSLLLAIWWLTFSRARWFERLIGLAGVGILLVAANFLLHRSMEGIGMMFLTIPMAMAAFGLGAIVFRNGLTFKRTILAVLLAACGAGFSTLLRTDGMWSDAKIAFSWRWTPSAEENLVIEKQTEPQPKVELSTESAKRLASPEWPAFRGADRSGRQTGAVFADSWSQTPELVWQIPVGPGWSSFSVAGNLLFTQEQRGEYETVVCYDADSGKEVWVFEVQTRFEEAIGGPGPRATPTLANLDDGEGGTEPSLFALGANGALVRLNPKTGEKIWQQELQQAADRKPPTWGFSSSPLVVGSNVIVHAGGTEDLGTLAFDVSNGDLVWSVTSGDHTYASPQLSTILGQDYVLMLSNNGLEIIDPENGQLKLNYEWKFQGYRSLQPLVIDQESVILPSGLGMGTRRVKLTEDSNSAELATEDMWTTLSLKPDFNDFVEYDGYLYGFDNSIFTCIDLETGERAWKGGRYGKGQVLLLEDSGLLLVASEKGEAVMLEATPEEHRELGRFQAIDGKTWNHPVVVDERLFIRNAENAACYRLPIQGGSD